MKNLIHIAEFKASVIEIQILPNLRIIEICVGEFQFWMVSDIKLLVDNRRISMVHQMENQFWSDLGY